MALGERQVALLVVEDELEVAEVLVEPAPVLAEDVALLVVLRPDARDLLVGPLPEVGPLGARVDVRCSRASRPRAAPPGARAAAGPGRPSPIGVPSSSIAGITSRIDDDVNASSAPARSLDRKGALADRVAEARPRSRAAWRA